MKKITSILALFCLVFFYNCKTSSNNINSELAVNTISENSALQTESMSTNYVDYVTSQHWVAGVKGGGSGNYIYVYLKRELPENTKLIKVVFNNKQAKFDKQEAKKYFANIMTKLPGNGAEAEVPFVQSNVKENEAELFFEVSGKIKTQVISNVKILEYLPYPSAKPNNQEHN